MNCEKTKMMVSRLMANIEKLRYGSASVTVKIHDGRVMQVSYSTEEHTRDTERKKDKDE